MSSQPMFRVFVSSTFTDFVHERRALQDTVFARLREYCEQRGARFQPIDLQWGVSEEAALDQQTLRLCQTEIRRCQRETPRPNFLVLLGNRYGWLPLPAAIPADEFDALVAHMSKADREIVCGSQAGGQACSGLYLRDDNALPAQYCLRTRVSAPLGSRARQREAQRWRDTEARVRAIFIAAIERAGWAADDPRRWKFEDSATHQEIREGALRPTAPEGAVLVYVRDFERQPQPGDAGAADFIDLERSGAGSTPPPRKDDEAAQRLAALREALRSRFNATHRFHRYVVRDHHCLRTKHISGAAAALIQALCDSIERDLRLVIDEELERLQGRETRELSEGAAHAQFASENSAVLVGRASILSRIARYFEGDRNTPLVIVGAPGSGKTTLLAKASRDAGLESGADAARVVAARFVGATPRSTAFTSFVADLCMEISAAYGDATPIPSDPELARSHLAEHVMKLATPERPLWLVLDGLDQLAGNTAGRELDWLPRRLPKHVRVVASLIQTKNGATDAHSRAAHVRWPRSLVALPGLNPGQAGELLGIWLRNAGRSLERRQRAHVLGRFAKNGLPLYLKLAFEEARRWKSWEGLPRGVGGEAGLARSVGRMVETLFHGLALPRQHGPVLVRRVVAFLSASRHGLAESEMMDLLCADEAVMEDFIRRSPTERSKPRRDRVKRLPWIVWSRLESDLAPYLLRRSMDGAVVASFNHQQIRDVGETLYAPKSGSRATHRTLAGYFRGRADPRARAKWSGTDARGFANLPYHLVRSAQRTTLHRMLLDFGWLAAKMRHLGIAALLEDYSWTELDTAALRVREALQLSRDALGTTRGGLAAQLLGRLQDSRSRKIRAMLERAEAHDGEWSLKPLSRSLTPPSTRAIRILRGHGAEVHDVALTPDDRMIVSCSFDALKFWDLQTGALIRTIHRKGTSFRAVAITPDGTRVLITTHEKTIETWEVQSERRLKPLRGHAHCVNSVAISANGRLAITGSSDSTAKSWNLETGRCLATFNEHTNVVRDVALSPNGRLAFSASNDRTVWVWDPQTGVGKRRLVHDDFVFAVAVSDDGHHVLTGAGDGTLRLWDLRTEERPPPLAAHDGFVYDAAFTRGWRHAASCGYDHMIRLWQLGSKKLPQVLVGHAGPVNAIAPTRKGKRLVSGSHDGSVRIWDLQGSPESGYESRHLSGIRALAVTPDGRLSLSAADDRELRIWNLKRRSSAEPLPGHQAPIAISADGAIALTGGGGDYARDLIALDLMTRAVLWRKPYFEADQGAYNWTINSIAITPDGTRALVGSTANELTIWDVSQGDRLQKLPGHRGCINAVRIAARARIAVTGSNDGTVRLWELDRAMRRRLVGRMDEIIEHVAVTSDARTVVAAPRHEGSITAWDTVARERLWRIGISRSEELAVPGYVSYVNDMAITPDGKKLVIASEDHSLTVRNPRDGTLLASFVGDTSMLACGVAPGGNLILAGERSGRLHFLRLEDERA